MFKRLFTKFMTAAAIVAMAFGIGGAAACNMQTDHPEVRISVEFNGGTYDLYYTLYRNMYPTTVGHFITLAENGIYNDMLVHDTSRSTDWISGGYKYDAADFSAKAEANALADYLQEHSVETSYMELFNAGKLNTGAYNYTDRSMLPTLVGEFSKNSSPEIENGKPTAQTGSLKMYYYEKKTTEKVLSDFGQGELFQRDYKYNCATSLFAMQIENGNTLSGEYYCVFGRLNNLDALQSLKDAIADYDGASTTVTGVSVDNDVEIYSPNVEDKGITQSFKMYSQPLVIRSVTVTKY